MSKYDFTLDSIKYRIARGGDSPGYRRSWRRQEFIDQQIRPANRLTFHSRPDRAIFYQTSWAGGSTWWKPLYDTDTLDTYFTSANMDAFSKPGTVLPLNKATTSSTVLLANSPMFAVKGVVYGIGNTQTEDATHYDIYKWTPASDDWVRETGYTSGQTSANILGVAYNPTDGYVYVMSDTHISRFNPTTSATNATWQALTSTPGDTIMFSKTGIVTVWQGGKLQKMTTVPALSDLDDDGMGTDLLADMAIPANEHLDKTNLRLAVSASNGMFYAKNTITQGLPVAELHRVDRNDAGSYINYPLTTLPEGVIVLYIAVHLGSVIMACTPDWRMVMANDRSTGEYPRIDLYHFTQGGGLNVLGSPEREAPDELPASILGSDGTYLFLGSNKRVWAYDAGRGGLHTHKDLADRTDGVYRSLAMELDSGGDQITMTKAGTASQWWKTHTADPTTVGSFDTDLTTYVMESNYFDFGFPFEDKTILAVDIYTETLTANQQYAVYISVDDGAFAKVVSHSNATTSVTDLSASSYTGKRFRFKVVYETKDAVVKGFRGVQFTAAQGVMVPVWNVIVDGTQSMNVDNDHINPETIHDNLETLAAKETQVTLIDAYRSIRDEDTATYTVTVANVQMVKDSPGEALIEIEMVGTS